MNYKARTLLGIDEHPLRQTLAEEIRARPYEHLCPPVTISHIAGLSGEGKAKQDRAHAAKLFTRYGAKPPPDDSTHFSAELGDFRFTWERHTEFSSYTFYCRPRSETPFEIPAIELVPKDWLAATPGKVLAAVHLTIEPRSGPERPFDELAALFNHNTIAGSRVLGGQARLWTDLRIYEDGFTRVLIRDDGLNERQTGRLAQRMLEISTYRIMAMLAFPLARKAGPKIAADERTLSDITNRLAKIDDMEGERNLLQRLSALAAETEAISAAANYRFSATRAYYDLLQRRINELREDRIEGLQPPGQFLYRRLTPAMKTCESVAERQEVLSKRIARTGDLLRTRVDVALEENNRDLLQSMNKRAKVQLRLQETVEGLSLVAISYYLLGLISHFAKGAEELGLDINPEIASAIALPFVVAAVWFGVRRMRRVIAGDDKNQE